ncbi:MAG: hypothetical protein WBC06_05490 [Chitinophagaceae bacterium]
MKLYQFLILFSVIIVVACNKDKFTTVPQVELKSISPETVFNGDIIKLEGKYTDQEGDLDSVLIVYKWYNNTTVVRNDTFRYSFDGLGIPDKTRQADIDVTFEYNTNNYPDLVPLPGVSIKDTTATLGLILKDKEANRSEFKESGKIRLKKP